MDVLFVPQPTISEGVRCPDGETRGAKELVVKLIVAHLTAVVAFCNLQSLRNERLDTIEPVLFLFSPFIVAIQTAAGLVVIHALFINNMVRSPRSWSNHIQIYAYHWSILFARKPQLGPLIVESNEKPKAGKVWIQLGRLAVMVGTLFQFVATVFLYTHRRDSYGSEALSIIDQRTFELAVGGIIVTVMSILLLLKLPGFRQAPLVAYTGENSSRVEQILLFCRGDSRRCPRWYQTAYIPIIYGDTSSGLAWCFCALSVTYNGQLKLLQYSRYLQSLFLDMLLEEMQLDFSIYVLPWIIILLDIALWSFISNIERLGISKRQFKNPRVLALVLFVGFVAFFSSFWIMLLLIGIVISPLSISLGYAGVFGALSTIVLKGLEIYGLFSQPPFKEPRFGDPCLWLWKDPMADYLWSLL